MSGILQRAHDTAAQITAQSRSEAEDRLETARQEAAQLVQRAEDRVRELDAETDRIWAERQRIVEDTRELARELLTLTDSAADRFPAEQAGAEAALPGPDAMPPDGIEAVAPVLGAPGAEDFEVGAPEFDVEAPEFEGDPLEFEVGAPEFGVRAGEAEPDAEPTAILPVIEPAEPGAQPAPELGVQPPPESSDEPDGDERGA